MKLFSYLYDKMLVWSAHRHAPLYLAGVSFAESSFFPIPPDVMLISMGLATPKSSWKYALIATLFSVAGGIAGYLIGMYAILLIEPYLSWLGLEHHYQQVLHWFKDSGVWIVILAAVTPFPYKIFTIAAGAIHISFAPFVIGSILGRGMRFFLISSILYYTGERIEQRLRYYIDIIGWSFLVAAAVIFCLMKWVL